MSTQEARHVVLRTKEHLMAIGAAASLPREQFVGICTAVSRDFIRKRNGAFSLPLSAFDEQLLGKMAEAAVAAAAAAAAVPAGGPASSPSRSSPLPAGSTGTGASSSSPPPPGSAQGIGAPAQMLVLPPIKVTVATEVKRLLNPLFAAQSITKRDFSTLVQEVTQQFFASFPLHKATNPQLQLSDLRWIEATLACRLRDDLGLSAAAIASLKTPTTTNTAVAAAAAAAVAEHEDGSPVQSQPPPMSVSRPRGDGNAFDLQLQKLREVLLEQQREEGDDEGEGQGAADEMMKTDGTPAPSGKVDDAFARPHQARRVALLRELREVVAETRRLQERQLAIVGELEHL